MPAGGLFIASVPRGTSVRRTSAAHFYAAIMNDYSVPQASFPASGRHGGTPSRPCSGRFGDQVLPDSAAGIPRRAASRQRATGFRDGAIPAHGLGPGGDHAPYVCAGNYTMQGGMCGNIDGRERIYVSKTIRTHIPARQCMCRNLCGPSVYVRITIYQPDHFQHFQQGFQQWRRISPGTYTGRHKVIHIFHRVIHALECYAEQIVPRT